MGKELGVESIEKEAIHLTVPVANRKRKKKDNN